MILKIIHDVPRKEIRWKGLKWLFRHKIDLKNSSKGQVTDFSKWFHKFSNAVEQKIHYDSKKIQPNRRTRFAIAVFKFLTRYQQAFSDHCAAGALQTLSPASKFVTRICRKDRDPLLRVSVMAIIFYKLFSSEKYIR